jgi:hypothetical protein
MGGVGVRILEADLLNAAKQEQKWHVG